MCIAFFLLGGGGGGCLCVWSHVCWRADLVKPFKKKKNEKEEEEANLKLNIGPKED